jgi:hypothetical protein
MQGKIAGAFRLNKAGNRSLKHIRGVPGKSLFPSIAPTISSPLGEMIRSFPNMTSIRGLYMKFLRSLCFYYTTEGLKTLRFQHLMGAFPRYLISRFYSSVFKVSGKLSRFEFHGFGFPYISGFGFPYISCSRFYGILAPENRDRQRAGPKKAPAGIRTPFPGSPPPGHF